MRYSEGRMSLASATSFGSGSFAVISSSVLPSKATIVFDVVPMLEEHACVQRLAEQTRIAKGRSSA